MTQAVHSDKELGDAFGRLARKLWRKLSKARKHVLRRRDVDAIHDLRVTTRRIQTLVDVGSVGRLDHSELKLRNRMKRLRHALGAARDIDVMLGRLRGPIRKSLGDQRRRLLRFVSRRLAAEAKRQGKLLRHELRRMDRRKVRRLSRRALLSRHFSGLSVEALAQAIARAERKLRSTVDAAAAQEDPRAYHDIRIKAKTLRHTIELASRFVVVADAGAIIEWLRRIQDDYGVWHDEVEECRRITEILSSGPKIQSDPAATELISSLRKRTRAHTRHMRDRLRSVRGALDSANRSSRTGNRNRRENRRELALETVPASESDGSVV